MGLCDLGLDPLDTVKASVVSFPQFPPKKSCIRLILSVDFLLVDPLGCDSTLVGKYNTY